MQGPVAPPQSLDEFDILPDDFDFSAVEDFSRLAPMQLRTQRYPDEYDLYNETDTFADIDLDTIAELGPPAPPAVVPSTPPVGQPLTNAQPPPESNADMESQRRQDSDGVSAGSTQYSFDEIDSAFLEEVDAIEHHVVRTEARASTVS